jgi:molybdopterin-containing oxidoreductase family membrane subunit
MIVPVLETPYLPMQDLREDWAHYSATWVEWSLTLSGVACFILFFILASKLAPIMPVSEMLEKSKKHNWQSFFKNKKNLSTSKQYEDEITAL